MSQPSPTRTEEQDWRLQAELEVEDRQGLLNSLLGKLPRSSIAGEVKEKVGEDVVVTHDGRMVFMYAADEVTLGQARGALEWVLGEEGVKGEIRISHWDKKLDEWRQTDPAVTEEERRSVEVRERDGERLETQTLVAMVGKMIRVEFERSMVDWAKEVGVRCEVMEHPHLLDTQVGFTVSGPKRKVEEFRRGLEAEERATVRTERAVMMSPI
jgi:acylphosphatase